MREIKFKMKIKGDAKVWKVHAIDWFNLKALRNVSSSMEWVDFDKVETFLQYTGIKDECEKEIFEYDILKDQDFKGIVYFIDGSFLIREIYPDNEDKELWNISSEYKIIGNIFENKDLL